MVKTRSSSLLVEAYLVEGSSSLMFGCSMKLEVTRKKRSIRNSISTIGVRFMMDFVIRFSRNRIVLFNVQEFQSCPRKDAKIAKFNFRVFWRVSWVICCCQRQHNSKRYLLFIKSFGRIKFIQDVHGILLHFEYKGIHFFVEITISNQGWNCNKEPKHRGSNCFCKPAGKGLGLPQTQL